MCVGALMCDYSVKLYLSLVMTMGQNELDSLWPEFLSLPDFVEKQKV